MPYHFSCSQVVFHPGFAGASLLFLLKSKPLSNGYKSFGTQTEDRQDSVTCTTPTVLLLNANSLYDYAWPIHQVIHGLRPLQATYNCQSMNKKVNAGLFQDVGIPKVILPCLSPMKNRSSKPIFLSLHSPNSSCTQHLHHSSYQLHSTTALASERRYSRHQNDKHQELSWIIEFYCWLTLSRETHNLVDWKIEVVEPVYDALL